MAIVGENEMAEKMVTLKDIISGEQKKVSYDNLAGNIEPG